MKQFDFKLYGGITLTFEQDSFTIDVKGVKGLFFQRIKPRTQIISYQDLKRVDYKGAGLTIGYIRFITPDIEDYPSSMYVAENCPNSIIFEKDEMDKFNELMNFLQKKFPQIEKVHKKM